MKTKLKTGLASLVTLGALSLGSSNGNADTVFPDSGVWEKPRIYSVEGSKDTEVDYSAVNLGTHRFKAKIENSDEEAGTTTSLFGEVVGPEYLSNTWSEISLSPGGDSIRYWTGELSTPGEYTLNFSLK